jgi:hypothetical protein
MQKKKTTVPKVVSEYMADLGRKGGAAGKGDQKRRELNRKAAKARWDKYRAQKRANNE